MYLCTHVYIFVFTLYMRYVLCLSMYVCMYVCMCMRVLHLMYRRICANFDMHNTYIHTYININLLMTGVLGAWVRSSLACEWHSRHWSGRHAG